MGENWRRHLVCLGYPLLRIAIGVPSRMTTSFTIAVTLLCVVTAFANHEASDTGEVVPEGEWSIEEELTTAPPSPSPHIHHTSAASRRTGLTTYSRRWGTAAMKSPKPNYDFPIPHLRQYLDGIDEDGLSSTQEMRTKTEAEDGADRVIASQNAGDAAWPHSSLKLLH